MTTRVGERASGRLGIIVGAVALLLLIPPSVAADVAREAPSPASVPTLPLSTTLSPDQWEPPAGVAHLEAGAAARAIDPYAPDPVQQAMIAQMLPDVSDDHLLELWEDLVGFGTRYAHTDNATESTQWIFDILNATGRLEVSFAPCLSYCPVRSEDGTDMRNIIAVLPGTDPSAPQVHIGAHVDSTVSGAPGNNRWVYAPGADDDGSGTVALIEAAYVLSQYRFRNTIVFAGFDAEELGLRGSLDYAALLGTDGVDVLAILDMDMVSREISTHGMQVGYNAASLPIALAVQNATARYNLPLTNIYYQTASVPTDVNAYWVNGYRGIFLSEYDFQFDLLHTNNDVIANYNLSLLADATRLVVATAAELSHLQYMDLRVPSGSLDTDAIAANEGDTVNLSVDLSNWGNTDATNVTVSFFEGPVLLGNVTVPSLVANDSIVVPFPYVAEVAGNVTLLAMVDPLDELVELDEGNNTVAAMIHVNAAPVPSLAVSPTTAMTGEPLHIDASGSADDLPGLSFHLDLGDGNDTGWVSQSTLDHAYERAGEYLITLWVRDDSGLQAGPRNVSVTILNRLPQLSLLLNRSEVLTHETVLVTIAGADVEGPVALSYDLPGAIIGSVEPAAGGMALVASWPDDGTYAVTATALDGDSAVAQLSATVVVHNRAPSVAIIAPTLTLPPMRGQTVTLSANGTDLDGAVGGLEWTLDGLSVLTQGQTGSVDLALGRHGLYQVTVAARDDDGALSEVARWSLEVLNLPPLPQIAALGAAQPSASVLHFDGSASSDPDGTIALFVWDLGDGTAGEGATVSHGYPRPGTYAVTLKVIDDSGATAATTVDVVVANRGPTAAIAPIGLQRPHAVVELNASGSTDDDGEVVEYHWRIAGEAYEGQVVALVVGQEDLQVELTVTDDSGATDTAALTIVIDHTPLPPPKQSSYDNGTDQAPNDASVMTTVPVWVALALSALVAALALALVLGRRRSRKDPPPPPQHQPSAAQGWAPSVRSAPGPWEPPAEGPPSPVAPPQAPLTFDLPPPPP